MQPTSADRKVAVSLARRFTRNADDAEDLVQAVMLRILRRGRQGVSLAALVRDEWRDLLRRRDAERKALAEAVETRAPCAADEATASAGELSEEVTDFLAASLRDIDEHGAAELSIMGGLNDREAGEQLGVSTRTANRRRHRAEARIRRTSIDFVLPLLLPLRRSS